jgi:hypothetical protein
MASTRTSHRLRFEPIESRLYLAVTAGLASNGGPQDCPLIVRWNGL